MLHTYVDDMWEAWDSAFDGVEINALALQFLQKLSHGNLIVHSIVQGTVTSLKKSQSMLHGTMKHWPLQAQQRNQ